MDESTQHVNDGFCGVEGAPIIPYVPCAIQVEEVKSDLLGGASDLTKIIRGADCEKEGMPEWTVDLGFCSTFDSRPQHNLRSSNGALITSSISPRSMLSNWMASLTQISKVAQGSLIFQIKRETDLFITTK